MKFQLWQQKNFPFCLEVTREMNEPPIRAGMLLAERDPLSPISFRSEHLYFNPLFKKMGGLLHPFLINGENELVSLFTGQSPKRFKRALREQVARGWFELTSRPIPLNEIPAELEVLIDQAPRLKGVIAQVAATTMGLRIPEDLVIQSADQWRAWFTSQRVLLTPQMRQAFNLLQTRNNHLIFPDDITIELQTGITPEKLFSIRIRWFEQKRIRIIQDQIFESQEWVLEVPETVLKGGEEAILKFADEKFSSHWRELGSYPVGGERVAEEIDPANKIEGPLIWIRSTEGRAFILLNPTPANAGRPKTINDLLQQVITNEPTTT